MVWVLETVCVFVGEGVGVRDCVYLSACASRVLICVFALVFVSACVCILYLCFCGCVCVCMRLSVCVSLYIFVLLFYLKLLMKATKTRILLPRSPWTLSQYFFLRYRYQRHWFNDIGFNDIDVSMTLTF